MRVQSELSASKSQHQRGAIIRQAIMYRFARDDAFDVEEFRTRLRKMSDGELIREGKAARYMASLKDTRQVFVTQLEECKAEWRRQPPKK